MSASPLSFLSDGPPPPRVALLPDSLFFSRAVPVSAEGPDAKARLDEVAGQAELAFETLAPFPLPQLFHGHFWVPGASHALVYAAYRRRFTAEQTEAWSGAELVVPAFAALLGARPEPATTIVLQAAEGLTAIHWADGPAPARVAFRPLASDATDDQRAETRTALLRQFESRNVVDLPEMPAAQPGQADDEFLFQAGPVVSRLSAATARAMDVRDKGELAVLRRARRRDVMLWRTGLGCLGLFVLLAVGELALVAGHAWQAVRRQQLVAQAPAVEQIQSMQEIATRIETLRTKRLLTLEMLAEVDRVRPPQTWLTSASSSDSNLYTLIAQGQTKDPAEISVMQDALQNLPQVVPGGVSIKQTRTSNAGSNFNLVVAFKPGSIKASVE